jgi:hypothetical protein
MFQRDHACLVYGGGAISKPKSMTQALSSANQNAKRCQSHLGHRVFFAWWHIMCECFALSTACAGGLYCIVLWGRRAMCERTKITEHICIELTYLISGIKIGSESMFGQYIKQVVPAGMLPTDRSTKSGCELPSSCINRLRVQFEVPRQGRRH